MEWSRLEPEDGDFSNANRDHHRRMTDACLDDICDLPSLARVLRRQARSYVPPQVSAFCAYAAATPIEALARVLRRRSIVS